MRLFAGTPFDRPPRCETCGALEEECRCPPSAPERIPPEKQTARVNVENRKNGKQVTVVRGLPSAGNDLISLLTQLKSHCGAGGTLKENELEIQGDQSDRIRGKLRELGYRVK
jgi:translation initiation factor 1